MDMVQAFPLAIPLYVAYLLLHLVTVVNSMSNFLHANGLDVGLLSTAPCQ